MELNLAQLGTKANALKDDARLIVDGSEIIKGKNYKGRLCALLPGVSKSNRQIWGSLKQALAAKYKSDIVSKVIPDSTDTQKPLTARRARQILDSARSLNQKKMEKALNDELHGIAKEKGQIFGMENELKALPGLSTLKAEFTEVEQALSEALEEMDASRNSGSDFSDSVTLADRAVSLSKRRDQLAKDISRMEEILPAIAKKEGLNLKESALICKREMLNLAGRSGKDPAVLKSMVSTGAFLSEMAEDFSEKAAALCGSGDIKGLQRMAADFKETFGELSKFFRENIKPDMTRLETESEKRALNGYDQQLTFFCMMADTVLEDSTRAVSQEKNLGDREAALASLERKVESLKGQVRNHSLRDKAAQAGMLAENLPGIQAMAQKSPEAYAAYRELMTDSLKHGLLDGKMRDSIMDTNALSPSQTLGFAKFATEYASFDDRVGADLKTDFLSRARNRLADQISKLKDPALSGRCDALAKAPDDQKEAAQDRLFKAFWDASVSRLKTDLGRAKPGSRNEKALQKALMTKYKKLGDQSITERDFEKMGRLLKDKRALLNLGILARYVLKGGEFKPTAYTDTGIKDEVKAQIKKTLGKDKISTIEGVKKVAGVFKQGEILSPEKLTYLKNKLKTKMGDYLPVAGNDPWVDKMNSAILEAMKKDLFIAPEKMKSDMLGIKGNIGSGGGNARIYKTSTKSEMIKNAKYPALTRQLEALTHEVNSSGQFAFKVFQVKADSLEEHKVAAEREMAISKALDHPNIVKAYFAVNDISINRLGIVMDYCEKGDFAKVLKADAKTGGQYDPGTPDGVKNIAKIILGAVNGLHHMHQLGYVHRDMKPANIFMTGDGMPKVGDFGLTKKLGTEVRGLDSDYIRQLKDREDKEGTGGAGTHIYMPPEVANDKYLAGPSQDTYSMGMTALCAMFGGDDSKVAGSKSPFHFELKMKDKGDAEKKFQEWLGNAVFTQTEEGQKMKEFISKSLVFDPDKRIGYDASIRILNSIITG